VPGLRRESALTRSPPMPVTSGTSLLPGTAMRRLLAQVAVVAVLAWLPPAHGAGPEHAHPPVTANDWARIRLVIVAQREALIAGDGERAVAFATPETQRRFRTGRRFLEMARETYEPLLTARDAEFLEGAVIDGTVVQPLRLVLPDDTVLVALYAVERQRDGRWRIAGCLLAPSTLISS